MKRRFLPALFSVLFFLPAVAQKPDSLWLMMKDERAYIQHEVRKNQTLFTVAQQYNVPAIVLAQNNDLSFHETVAPGKTLLIPLGNYNLLRNEPAPGSRSAALYYRAMASDEWGSLSSKIDLPPQLLRDLNPGQLYTGRVLHCGWVQYDAVPGSSGIIVTETKPAGSAVVTTVSPLKLAPKKDTVRHPLSEHELMYNYQTSDETERDSLSGMVVFFQSQTTVSEGRLYAFCNDVPKGRVVKIVNPSNGKFAFARVLGPIPSTKQYHNAKIGVDNRAKRELGIRDDKLWCQLYFKL
jgi:LysM repeat protein